MQVTAEPTMVDLTGWVALSFREPRFDEPFPESGALSLGWVLEDIAAPLAVVHKDYQQDASAVDRA